MAWFLRKSIRVGPLRLNVSKRGMGASVGVRGLRTGVDASGKPYVAGGRGGIYFRERIRGTETERTRPGAPRSGSTRLAWTVAIVLAIIVLLLIFTR